MVAMQTTSRALNQLLLVLCLFAFGMPTLTNAQTNALTGSATSQSKAVPTESATAESAILVRPSVILTSLGLRFSTPNGWTAEDYPQLNGVLLLSPAANDAPKSSWRTRILVEVGKPQPGSDLSLLAANNAISILALGTQRREVARKTIRHAQGFDYGWVEATHVREPHALRDWRVVIRSKTGNDIIVITLSCARALWDIERAGFEAFIDQLKLQ